MNKIYLANNRGVVLVDEDNYMGLNTFNWKLCNTGYAIRNSLLREGRPRRGILMHRQIMGVTDPKIQVDHINHNKLDNRKCNLRLCTNTQNQYNRAMNFNSTSKYKGVYFNTALKYWVAQIQEKKHKIYLGYFKTKEAAAKAYNEAAVKHHGEFAKINKLLESK